MCFIHIPTGSEESTIIASYFPSGAFLKNSIAVPINKGKKPLSESNYLKGKGEQRQALFYKSYISLNNVFYKMT